MQYKHEVIFCVVNAGFSEMVMNAAREFGARGGTVLHARGTANLEAEKLFNISVEPEKDIVMILVESEIRDAILHSLYQTVGLQTEGGGIAFSMPVEDVVGLSKATPKPAVEANAPVKEDGKVEAEQPMAEKTEQNDDNKGE